MNELKTIRKVIKQCRNNIKQDIQNKPKLSLKDKLDKNKKLIEESKNIATKIKSNNRSL